MQKYNIILLLIGLLSTALLVGHSLDLRFFGGEGFTSYPDTQINEASFPRGASYAFGMDETIQLNDLVLTGQENTVIELQDTRPDSFLIHLVSDRLSVTGATSLRANQVTFQLDGSAEFIHFSWLDKIEITLREGSLMYIDQDDIPHSFIFNATPLNFTLSTETGLSLD